MIDIICDDSLANGQIVYNRNKQQYILRIIPTHDDDICAGIEGPGYAPFRVPLNDNTCKTKFLEHNKCVHVFYKDQTIKDKKLYVDVWYSSESIQFQTLITLMNNNWEKPIIC